MASTRPPPYSRDDPFSLDRKKNLPFAEVWENVTKSAGDTDKLKGALGAFRELIASQENAKISRNQLGLLRGLSAIILEAGAKNIQEGANVSDVMDNVVQIFRAIPVEVKFDEAWETALRDRDIRESKIQSAFERLEEQLRKLIQGKDLESTAYREELLAAQVEDRKKIDELEAIIRKQPQTSANSSTLLERSVQENLKIIGDPTVQQKQVEAKRALAILAELTGASLPPSTLLGKEFVTIGPHSIHSSATFEIFRGQYFTGEDIAIKLLRHRVDEDTARKTHERFARQALNWSSLRHDAILPFYGIGVANSPVAPGEVQLYLVSPYLQNQDVRRYLRKYHQAPLRVRLQMILDVARGLQHMHEATELPGSGNGIVHSALNIFNILIKDSGRAVISGFGHAKALQGFEASFTGDNSEYRYMAPEMMHDEARVTKGTDIWSWAMTALEILTDVPPFGEKTKGPRLVTLLATGQRPRRSDHPKLEEYHRANELWDLFTECWEEDSSTRPPADDVVHRVNSIIRELGRKKHAVEQGKEPISTPETNQTGRSDPRTQSGKPPPAPPGHRQFGRPDQPVVPGNPPEQLQGVPGQQNYGKASSAVAPGQEPRP